MMGIHPTEAAMWRCRNCGLEVVFADVDPEVDEISCFFLCPKCGHRNKLINVGPYGDEDPLTLGQPDD